MLLDRFRLDGKVAIVTGAGRGIGRGIALGLGEAGATVICAARTAAAIEDTAAEVTRRGGRGLAVPCDVLEEPQLERLVAETLRLGGGIDVLVNNAGGSMPMLAEVTSREDFEAAFRFNVSSAFVLSRLAIPPMLARGGGAIVNITSALSRLVESGFVSYGTAKAGLSQLTRLLACEYAPRIRVNAVCCGAVVTEALGLFLDDDTRTQMERLTPLGRLGTPEDVALLALYLASPASSWVTGKIYELDGGTVDSNWPIKIRPELEPGR